MENKSEFEKMVIHLFFLLREKMKNVIKKKLIQNMKTKNTENVRRRQTKKY